MLDAVPSPVAPVAPVLRVFSEKTADVQSVQLARQQLPYLKNLQEKIELMTGWKIDFAESASSYRARQNGASMSVIGSLAIEDMSFDRLPGMGIAPRSEVESLVQTLDQMLRVIQVDRQAREEFLSRVERVVNSECGDWKLRGVGGTHLGDIISCSSGPNGPLYVLSASLDGPSEMELSSAARGLQSVFQAVVAANLSWSDLQSTLQFHLSSLHDNLKLVGLAVVELCGKSAGYRCFRFGQQWAAWRFNLATAAVQPLLTELDDSEWMSLDSHELILLGDPKGESMTRWLDCRGDTCHNRAHVLHQLDCLSTVSPCVGIYRS